MVDLPDRRRSGKVRGERVTLAHGAGGRAMRDLIDDIFLSAFGAPEGALEDQARLALEGYGPGARLAFTTDAFVIDPIFFPGGDIGKLAVSGTVNDLAVGGARPVALSAALILEEGLLFENLRRVAAGMADAAEAAGVKIVTGDTKVVHRGAADKLFIATAGVGVIPAGRDLGAHRICPGDAILVSRSLGEHGAAVMAARDDLGLSTELTSDCRPLNALTEALITAAPGLRAMRDATRGGVAAVLNEFAQGSGLCARIEENRLPIQPAVRGISEILGLDPLYLANEGLFVAVLAPKDAAAAIAAIATLPGGEGAAVIGEIVEHPAGTLVMRSVFRGDRLVDMLEGDQLPRIC